MKIGFSNPWMAKLDVEAGTYSEGFKCGGAVSGSIKPNYTSVKGFADNKLWESSNGFSDADVQLVVSEIPAVAANVCFGHTVDEDGKVHFNINDQANWVGLGAIEEKVESGVHAFTATFVPRVMFAETGHNYQTKGENIAFQTETIEGSASADKNGDWQITMDFETEAEAITWIKNQLNIA